MIVLLIMTWNSISDLLSYGFEDLRQFEPSIVGKDYGRAGLCDLAAILDAH